MPRTVRNAPRGSPEVTPVVGVTVGVNDAHAIEGGTSIMKTDIAECVECGDVRPRHDMTYSPHAGRILADGTRQGGKVCRSCAGSIEADKEHQWDCLEAAGVGVDAHAHALH